MDIKRIKIDYEDQIFDELDINSYEIVIAISKKAREINKKAQKYLGADTVVKPINLALKKLESKDLDFVYNTEEEPTPSEESSASDQ